MNDKKIVPSLGVIFRPDFAPEMLPGYARRAEAAGFDELWLWDDCFQPGALTCAAVALAATQRIQVGIGILPATVYNPLFAAMEITTLARAFPGRILPGLGHGVSHWMEQIGAAPASSMKSLGETVSAVRRLLSGEVVTVDGDQVHLDHVQMKQIPDDLPPLYVGAMREKTLHLAGRVGDGTILTSMSSPAYVEWAWEHIRVGMAESGRAQHRMVVYLQAKVGPDGEPARRAARRELTANLPWWADVHLKTLGIADEVEALKRERGAEWFNEHLPDAWLDDFAAAGTPQQAAQAVQRLWSAGADSVVLQPLEGDMECLEEYIKYLVPVVKR